MRISDWSSDVCSSDLKAISIGFDADRDYVTVDLTTLTDNRARAFELLKLALTAPRFDEEPLARIKAQEMVSFQRSRSEGRRVGKEGVRTGRSRGSRYN